MRFVCAALSRLSNRTKISRDERAVEGTALASFRNSGYAVDVEMTSPDFSQGQLLSEE